MDVLVLCAKTALACLLIVAGGAKLSDPASFASTVRLFIPFRVAWPWLSAIAVGVSLGELAVGLASLTLPAITALNALVFAIACAFVAVSAIGLCLPPRPVMQMFRGAVPAEIRRRGRPAQRRHRRCCGRRPSARGCGSSPAGRDSAGVAIRRRRAAGRGGVHRRQGP